MARDWGPIAGVGGRVGKSVESGICIVYIVGVRAMLCILVFVMCVAPPTHMGAWLMVVLLGQPLVFWRILGTGQEGPKANLGYDWHAKCLA